MKSKLQSEQLVNLFINRSINWFVSLKKIKEKNVNKTYYKVLLTPIPNYRKVCLFRMLKMQLLYHQFKGSLLHHQISQNKPTVSYHISYKLLTKIHETVGATCFRICVSWQTMFLLIEPEITPTLPNFMIHSSFSQSRSNCNPS